MHELQHTLTASELKMWIAFDRISPIGDWRGDAQSAQIAAAVFNAQGGKANMVELMLKYGPQDEEEEISELEQWFEQI